MWMKITRDALRRMVLTEFRHLREVDETSDYSQDERFQSMIDAVYDLVRDYSADAAEIVAALGAAVDEGDQR
jgi:hypothetical protein